MRFREIIKGMGEVFGGGCVLVVVSYVDYGYVRVYTESK